VNAELHSVSSKSIAEPCAIGRSSVFLRILRQVDQIAPTDRAILILGPSGSGKEVVAQRVHYRGRGAGHPFVDLNCGAIPEHLIETELFGCARGAFTGAVASRPGHFETVGRGTLFLDEIGELPMSLQPKLLRVLDTRTFRPVGSNETRRFEGRVIAATHRNLKSLVKEGLFREDLYYRLAVFEVEMPGLDQRREDIPALAEYFSSCQSRPLTFTPEALALMARHDWPGHARQLRNLIDRLSVLAGTPHITADVLQPFLMPAPPSAPAPFDLAAALLQLDGKNKLVAAEQFLVDHALQRCGGNKTAAALLLGVGRKSIERRLKLRAEKFLELQEGVAQGRALVARSEFHPAIEILQKALALKSETLMAAETRHLLFEGYRLLGVCHRSTQGWLSPDARLCDQAALERGSGVCDAIEMASLQFGVWSTQLMVLDLAHARSTAQEMVRRAQASGMPDMLDEAQVALSNTLFWLGDCEESLATLMRAGFAADWSRERIGMQGFDLLGLALTIEGLAAFQHGAFGRARQARERLEQRCAAEHHHAFNRAIVLQGAAWLACLFEDTPAFGLLADELASLSLRSGFIFYRGVGQIFQGWHLAECGDFEAGLQTIVAGYEHQMLNHGGRLFHSFQAWKRAEILLRAGRPSDCAELATRALDTAVECQERVYLCELMETRARALLATGSDEEAEHGLRGALSTAFALGSVPTRISAATHLAQHLLARQRPGQALEILEHAVRGIARSDAPPILQRACKLIDFLRAASPASPLLERQSP
jgi:DNA-binding NtrC family response regulator